MNKKRYAVAVKHSHSSRAALAATVLAASLLFTGCSLLPGGGSTGGGGGTGGSGQSGSGDGSSNSGSTTDSPPGGPNLDDFQGKPDTFPSEIPLIAGDIPFGVDLGTGWTVIVQVDDLVKSFTDASKKIESAGFTTLQTQTTPQGSFAAFENAKYQLQLTAADTGDYGLSLTYLVVLKG